MQNFINLQSSIEDKLRQREARIDRYDNLWDAAVLLPLVETDEGIAILFEVRSSRISRQPGDICFPGGKKESFDSSFEETAVRETAEELGIDKEKIKIIGALDYLVTHMGPIIHPYVGVIEDWQDLNYNHDEVEEVFTVPLKFFMTNEPRTANMLLANRAQDDFPFDLLPRHPKEWQRRKNYKVYFYQYGKYVIWGLTARMLYGFLHRFYDELMNWLEGEDLVEK